MLILLILALKDKFFAVLIFGMNVVAPKALLGIYLQMSQWKEALALPQFPYSLF